MSGLAMVYAVAGVVVLVLGALMEGFRDPKLRTRGALVMAFGYGLHLLMCLEVGSLTGAAIEAGLVAWRLYDWWNSGGGDGLKKKLRKLVPQGPAPQTT